MDLVVVALIVSSFAFAFVAISDSVTALAGMIAVGMIFCQPTIFGVQFGPYGALAVLVACCAVVALSPSFSISGYAVAPILLLTLAWAWVLIRWMIIPDSNFDVVNATRTFFLPVIAFAFAMSNTAVVDRFRRLIVGVITTSAVITSVSVALGLLLGFSSLKIGVLPFGYSDVDNAQTAVVFPGSFLYGLGGSEAVPRFVGIGREPGVGALFFGWAFFMVPVEWRFRGAMRAALLLALLSTQSTAGIGLFAVCWIASSVLHGRDLHPAVKFLMLAVAAFFLWSALTSPNFGLLAKQDSGGESFSVRHSQTVEGLNALWSDPILGDSRERNASINLIASIADIGLPWAALMCVLLLWGTMRGPPASWRRYALLLIFSTVLLSQPLIYAVGIMLLALSSMSPDLASVSGVEAKRTSAITADRPIPQASLGGRFACAHLQ